MTEKTFHSVLLTVAAHKRHKLGHLWWSKNKLEPLKSSACTRLVLWASYISCSSLLGLEKQRAPRSSISPPSSGCSSIDWSNPSINKPDCLSSGPNWRHWQVAPGHIEDTSTSLMIELSGQFWLKMIFIIAAKRTFNIRRREGRRLWGSCDRFSSNNYVASFSRFSLFCFAGVKEVVTFRSEMWWRWHNKRSERWEEIGSLSESCQGVMQVTKKIGEERQNKKKWLPTSEQEWRFQQLPAINAFRSSCLQSFNCQETPTASVGAPRPLFIRHLSR